MGVSCCPYGTPCGADQALRSRPSRAISLAWYGVIFPPDFTNRRDHFPRLSPFNYAPIARDRERGCSFPQCNRCYLVSRLFIRELHFSSWRLRPYHHLESRCWALVLGIIGPNPRRISLVVVSPSPAISGAWDGIGVPQIFGGNFSAFSVFTQIHTTPHGMGAPMIDE